MVRSGEQTCPEGGAIRKADRGPLSRRLCACAGCLFSLLSTITTGRMTGKHSSSLFPDRGPGPPFVFGLTGGGRSCSLKASFRFHYGIRGNSVKIGDGPAAVIGDARRTESLTAGSGRRGARTIRESEYLPETRQPPPADQGDGAETRISKGIPGSLYDDPGIFFARRRGKTRIDAAGSAARHSGDDRLPSEERLPGLPDTSAGPRGATGCHVRKVWRRHRLPATPPP